MLLFFYFKIIKMKPEQINTENNIKNNNNKSFSFSFLLNLTKKTEEEDPISKFVRNYEIQHKNDNINYLKTHNDNEEDKYGIIRPYISSKKNEKKKDNIIQNNSLLYNKNGSKAYNSESTEKYFTGFPLAIVELQNLDKSKNEKVFLTDSSKQKKKKRKITITEEKDNSILKNNRIISNFYTDYMKRKKQKELVESKLFKQTLYSQILRYSMNYLKKLASRNEYKIHKERQEVELLKNEKSLKKYKEFKNRLKRRIIEGNRDSDNEKTNLLINSIHKFLYRNIMNYNNLIFILSRLKGKFSTNFAKMISEFLAEKFDCFQRIKDSDGGQLKMIKLVELLKLEKYKKGEIIYDIDNYENKYLLLLKGNVEVYERKYIIENMKICDFINYLRDIKEKDNNLIKLYRIIHKNISERTFDKFDILENNSFDCIHIMEHIDIFKKIELFIEEVRNIGIRMQGENINNIYKIQKAYNTDDDDQNYKLYNKKELLSKNSSPKEIKEFFKSKENRLYFLQNYSDKKYVCKEDCLLVSIEKDAYNKKILDLENKLFGEDAEMLSMYTFIFKNWNKELINSIIKKKFQKRHLVIGDYLYHQNDKSDKIYIIIRGEFSQSISLNTKRVNEVKKYFLYNKNNLFNIWKNRIKKTIIKEEIDEFFEMQEYFNGDFPYEINEKYHEIKEEEIDNKGNDIKENNDKENDDKNNENKNNENKNNENKENDNKEKDDKEKDNKEKDNKENDNNENINKLYLQYYHLKKKERNVRNEVNNITNLKIKKCYKFEVLGIEDSIDGKHRFTSAKCESRHGEVIEIKISDFIYFCFQRNININYLKNIILNLKNILIRKIEQLILVGQNSLQSFLENYDNNNNNKEEIITKNNSNKKNELQINKKIEKTNYFEEQLFDPLDIALNNVKKYKLNKIKEKYNIINALSPDYINNNYSNRSYQKNKRYKDLFYNYFTEREKEKEKEKNKNIIIKIYNNQDNNNNRENQENTEENNKIKNINGNDINNNDNIVNENIMNSARSLKKKIFLENLRINNFGFSTKRNKNEDISEREKIKRQYLIAKRKLEESYFNREKVYYMRNFKGFPFVKYIYEKNKKKKINYNTEETLYTKMNKDLKKQQKLNDFIEKLNSSDGKNNILFSKSVLKEAGYCSNNYSYRKSNKRNNKINNLTFYHYNTDNNMDNYNLDVCFLKHIDFMKINNNKKC